MNIQKIGKKVLGVALIVNISERSCEFCTTCPHTDIPDGFPLSSGRRLSTYIPEYFLRVCCNRTSKTNRTRNTQN